MGRDKRDDRDDLPLTPIFRLSRERVLTRVAMQIALQSVQDVKSGAAAQDLVFLVLPAEAGRDSIYCVPTREQHQSNSME